MALESRTVWIVDDSRTDRQATAEMLRPTHVVSTFASGNHVLEQLHQEELPDLLVLDLLMEDVSGLEVLQFLRHDPTTAQLPVVVLSASRAIEDVSSALRSGADDFVRKPVDPVELRARVSRLLQRESARVAKEREIAERWLIERQRALSAEDVVAAEQRQRREVVERAELAELFMGVLGHDLRSPLAAVSLSIGLLMRDDLDREARKLGGARAMASVARMTELIGRVLDLTRVGLGGGIRLDMQWLDVRTVCEQIVEEVRVAHPEGTLRFEVRGETELAIDAVRFGQVVANLLANALQHGSRDQPVELLLTGDEAGVRVAVRNGGPPIPAPLLATLFEPFRRAFDGAASATGNMGLGLYISKQIVEAHGGRVDVVSQPESTTFTVTLPRAPRRD